MKILRVLGRTAMVLGVLLLTAVLVAMIPAVQTALATAYLKTLPGVDATLGSVTAGFGRIEVETAHIGTKGARIDIPSLQVQLPILRTLLTHDAQVSGLISRGWTVDLTHASASEFHPRDAAEARAAALALLAGLGAWRLPFDGRYDGIEIEGDVLWSSDPAGEPTRIHVTAVGGGIAPAVAGSFTVDTSASGLHGPVHSYSAHGHLDLAPAGAGAPGHAKLSADVVLSGPAMPVDLTFSVDAASAHAGSSDTYDLTVHRASKVPVELHARVAQSGAVSGSWALSVADADVAAFMPDRTLPAASASGSGQFSWDPAKGSVSAQGRIEARLGEIGAWNPWLAPLDQASLQADVDIAANGPVATISRLAGTVNAPRFNARVRALQGFSIDLATGALSLSNPVAEVLEAQVNDLPTDLLFAPGSRIRLASGKARTAFRLRPLEGSFAVELTEPFAVSGADLMLGASRLVGGVSFEAPAHVSVSPRGVSVSLAQTQIRASGHPIGSVGGSASRSQEASGAWSVQGKAVVDLGALAQGDAVAALSAIAGATATLDFSGTAAEDLAFDCALKLSGAGKGREASCKLHIEIDPDLDFTFKAPVTVTTDTGTSDVNAEGSVEFGREGSQIEVAITGDSVRSEHLLLLAAPFVTGAQEGPFWGNLRGKVVTSFQKVVVGADSYDTVAAQFRLTDDTLRLERGRSWVLDHNLGKAEGAITYARGRHPAYSLAATATADDVEATYVFGKGMGDALPPLEGRLAFTAAIASQADSLAELRAKATQTLQLRSNSGIFRLLKVNVGDAIPEASEPVSDTLGSVGSAMGVIFGLRKGFPQSGKNPVSKQAEAVLNFTYEISEIGYDHLAAELARNADGSVAIRSFSLACPEARISGSGTIAASDQPLVRRPVHLTLSLALSGDSVALLAPTHLLAKQKDADGFTPFKQSFEFAGTLLSPDSARWHDLLAAAATAKPAH